MKIEFWLFWLIFVIRNVKTRQDTSVSEVCKDNKSRNLLRYCASVGSRRERRNCAAETIQGELFEVWKAWNSRKFNLFQKLKYFTNKCNKSVSSKVLLVILERWKMTWAVFVLNNLFPRLSDCRGSFLNSLAVHSIKTKFYVKVKWSALASVLTGLWKKAKRALEKIKDSACIGRITIGHWVEPTTYFTCWAGLTRKWRPTTLGRNGRRGPWRGCPSPRNTHNIKSGKEW